MHRRIVKGKKSEYNSYLCPLFAATYPQWLSSRRRTRLTIIGILNKQQVETLASLPDEQREYMARMFRIGNAAYCYHNQVNNLSVFNTADQNTTPGKDVLKWLERQLTQKGESQSARELLAIYFEEYLEGLPHEGLRKAERARDLNEAKRSFPFRRYVLERHDIGMNEFLRQHLNAEDYAFHQSTDEVKFGKPLKDQ